MASKYMISAEAWKIISDLAENSVTQTPYSSNRNALRYALTKALEEAKPVEETVQAVRQDIFVPTGASGVVITGLSAGFSYSSARSWDSTVKKIDLIKAIRSLMNTGLKESKDMVDGWLLTLEKGDVVIAFVTHDVAALKKFIDEAKGCGLDMVIRELNATTSKRTLDNYMNSDAFDKIRAALKERAEAEKRKNTQGADRPRYPWDANLNDSVDDDFDEDDDWDDDEDSDDDDDRFSSTPIPVAPRRGW